MQWVFEHFQVIIAVAAAITYMLNRGKQAPEASAESGDDDDSQRARQIREEIRRKIAERRQGSAPNVMPTEAPSVPPVMSQQSLPPIDPFGGSNRPALPTFRRTVKESRPIAQTTEVETMAVLERQEQLSAQMRALEKARQVQQRRAEEIIATAATDALPAAPASRGGLLADLRKTQNLRRAVLLREVLGPPVALR